MSTSITPVPPIPDVPGDWMEFPHPEKEKEMWRVDLSFIMSTWSCIYGQGCPGQFGIQDEHTRPDTGCCTIGVKIDTKTEYARVQSAVDQLTEDDLSPAALKIVREKGWETDYLRGRDDPDDPERKSVSTKVRNGGCIFANRSDENDDGRIGCAFYHLAARTGQNRMDLMPDICWTVPLVHDSEVEDQQNEEITVHLISSSRGKNWGGFNEDDNQDHWMSWWCMDTPDAYLPQSKRVYRTMEEELRRIMGDASYERMVEEIDKRKDNYIAPMPGVVRNEGRPMLPLLVGNRTPVNKPRASKELADVDN